MNHSHSNAIVSLDGFTASAELAERIENKSAKLRRHDHPKVGSLHLNLKLEKPHAAPVSFKGTATMRCGTRDTAIHAEGATPEILVNELFTKLERALHEFSGERKHARHAADEQVPA